MIRSIPPAAPRALAFSVIVGAVVIYFAGLGPPRARAPFHLTTMALMGVASLIVLSESPSATKAASFIALVAAVFLAAPFVVFLP